MKSTDKIKITMKSSTIPAIVIFLPYIVEIVSLKTKPLNHFTLSVKLYRKHLSSFQLHPPHPQAGSSWAGF